MSTTPPTDPDTEAKTSAAASARLFGASRRMSMQTPKEALQPELAPPPPGPPPSKRRPTLSAISGFLSFLLIAAVGAIAAFAVGQQQLRAPGPLQSDKVVLIAPRTEVHEILAQLETEGVIDNPLLLNAALVLEGTRSRVKAGEYLFKEHASLRDVIDTLVSGREILHSITIPEGLTSEQIIQRLKDNDLLTGDIRDIPKEGTLLPETYRVARGMARTELIRKMQDGQKKLIDQVWARRSADIPLHSSYELVTLASIVEKETGKADERPRVAGVFLNRLSKRMRLQSDPTIVYGLVGGKGTLGRGILRSEVERSTPYNTYVIEGLPPGPIANPGKAALEAVANPSRTRDLYFVADGTGGHAFAETIDQHNKNVLRWRQIEKENKERQDAPPADVDHIQGDIAPAPIPAPSPTAPPRGQRGELTSPAFPVFGALPTGFGEHADDAPLAFAADDSLDKAPAAEAIAAADATQAASAISVVASLDTKNANGASGAPADNGKPAPLSNFSLKTQLDPAVVATFEPPPNLLDGPIDSSDDTIDPTAYPVSPTRRAEQRAKAAKYHVSAGGDDLPAATVSDTDRSVNLPGVPEPTGPRVVKIYDASEGTTFDPLKDKSWDLNSPKTVPNLLPEPKLAAKPKAKPKATTTARAAAPATH